MSRKKYPYSDDTFGGRLRKARDENNLTADSLAKLIGISQSFVSDAEYNRRPLKSDALRKLKENLNVDINWLLTGEGEPYIKDRAGDVGEGSGDIAAEPTPIYEDRKPDGGVDLGEVVGVLEALATALRTKLKEKDREAELQQLRTEIEHLKILSRDTSQQFKDLVEALKDIMDAHEPPPNKDERRTMMTELSGLLASSRYKPNNGDSAED
ncbi:MAG: helix-turn-helix domain-containing protein [Desulfobacteraceae bacterium]|jgi:transcriptional regulator with XRE-family HTH domain